MPLHCSGFAIHSHLQMPLFGQTRLYPEFGVARTARSESRQPAPEKAATADRVDILCCSLCGGLRGVADDLRVLADARYLWSAHRVTPPAMGATDPRAIENSRLRTQKLELATHEANQTTREGIHLPSKHGVWQRVCWVSQPLFTAISEGLEWTTKSASTSCHHRSKITSTFETYCRTTSFCLLILQSPSGFGMHRK